MRKTKTEKQPLQYGMIDEWQAEHEWNMKLLDNGAELTHALSPTRDANTGETASSRSNSRQHRGTVCGTEVDAWVITSPILGHAEQLELISNCKSKPTLVRNLEHLRATQKYFKWRGISFGFGWRWNIAICLHWRLCLRDLHLLV